MAAGAPGDARLFVAAWPDARTRAALADVPHTATDRFRYVPAERWHVTLRFLGAADVDDAVAALGGRVFPSATVVLGPRLSVLDGHLVAPASGADRLAAAVAAATRHVGDSPDRPFLGHLTVARRIGRRRHPGPDATGLDQAIHAEFDVDEIALVRSDLTADGPRYHTIARFPTAPPPAR